MANMRKDDNNVYIDLWGETLEFNKTEYALYQLSTAFEVRVANDIKTIVDKRIHGKAIENFKQVGNEVSFQFLPWIYDNIDYVKNTIKTSSALVKSILIQYDIDLTPNWNEINKKWIEQVEKIRQIYISAMNETVDALKRNDEIRYQQAYNEELSRDFGLGFGIISNSLVSHLLYAAQSASKEAKDHQRAAKYAYENSGETLEESTTKILHVVYPLYTDKMEPALTKLLSEYYAYVVSIFSKELNCSYDDVAITFDFNRSNAFILGVSDNAKANVLEALEAYPNNGNVIGYAIKNDILDDALCEYGNTAPSKFGIILKNWAVSVLSEIYQAGKLFNKPYVTDENRTIIKGLISYYEYIDDHSDSTDNDWQDILDAVYGDEIIEFVDIFEIFEESQNSNVEIINYAKANKKVVISDSMLAKFIVACNELKDGSCYWYATTMGLNPDESVSAEQVCVRIKEINAKIDAEIEVLKKQAEKNRQEEERRKAEELQRQKEIRKEKEIKKAKLKRKLKIRIPIVISILLLLFIGAFFLNHTIMTSDRETFNSAAQMQSRVQGTWTAYSTSGESLQQLIFEDNECTILQKNGSKKTITIKWNPFWGKFSSSDEKYNFILTNENTIVLMKNEYSGTPFKEGGTMDVGTSKPSTDYESFFTVLEITDVRFSVDGAYCIGTATLTNTGKKAYTDIKITGQFFDKYGDSVGIAFDTVGQDTSLKPGESVVVEVRLISSKAVSCTINATNATQE